MKASRGPTMSGKRSWRSRNDPSPARVFETRINGILRLWTEWPKGLSELKICAGARLPIARVRGFDSRQSR